jgi:NADH dehydrogenase
MADRPTVVIVGGGFGGLAAAKGLAGAPVDVLLLDKSNHHLFQPLLYQVATAALSAPDIAAPIRRLLGKQENARVGMVEVTSVDVESRQLRLVDGDTVPYDVLVLATGMGNAYFGNDQWAEHAPGLKTLHEALDIRARVLRAFEAAEREPDPEIRKGLLTFVVIGGGPTGVEMAGALKEIATRTLARDYRRFDGAEDTRVILVEGSDRILNAFHPESSAAAEKALEQIGVEMMYGRFVTDVTDEGVTVGDELIPTHTVVWAAGVQASPLTKDLGAELDRAGRVKVTPQLHVPGRPEVFVLGDLIHLEQDGELLPGVAQLAMQSGAYVAEVIKRRLADQSFVLRPFRYADKGAMATIGRAHAVAEVGGTRFSGFLAWLLWLFIHVLFLVDFRNRLAVMGEWAWAYLTWRRSARVIIDVPEREEPMVTPTSAE